MCDELDILLAPTWRPAWHQSCHSRTTSLVGGFIAVVVIVRRSPFGITGLQVVNDYLPHSTRTAVRVQARRRIRQVLDRVVASHLDDRESTVRASSDRRVETVESLFDNVENSLHHFRFPVFSRSSRSSRERSSATRSCNSSPSRPRNPRPNTA